MSEPCPLLSPHVRTVARWWIQAYRTDGLPSRHRIDVFVLRRALPFLWLMTYEPRDDTFRYRLAGEAINATLGVPLRGKRVEEVVEPSMLETVQTRLRHALDTPGAVHAIGWIHARSGRFREGERLILPLAETGAATTHLLGVTAYFAAGAGAASAGPAGHMDERFLTIADVLEWRESLAADLRG